MNRLVVVAGWLLSGVIGWHGAARADAVDDVRQWHALGLPMAAEWNVTNYSFDYHIEQVRRGHRFLPSVRLPTVDEANLPKIVESIGASARAWDFARQANLPICLRTANIANVFVGSRYRLPVVPESIEKSALEWRLVDGRLDDRRVVDCFGPVSNWENEGRLWGESQYLKKLQQTLPGPAYVIFLENNEGAYPSIKHYASPIRKVSPIEPGPTHAWLPLDQLEQTSLRMRDRVAELIASNPNTTPDDFLAEYWARRKAHYDALYRAFEASLTEAWRGRVLTAAYDAMGEVHKGRPPEALESLGHTPELTYYNSGSAPVYCRARSLTDFTSLDHLDVLNLIPAWDEARARNPRSFRELSLHITDGGTCAGALAGRHEVMTPARYEGYLQWLLWSIHDPGVPVILRHWCSARERPTTPLFPEDQWKTLEELGVAELKSATSDTYVQPILSAVDRVCTHSKLRDFWLRGRPVIVPGPGHPARELNDHVVHYPRDPASDRRWRFLECSINPPRETWIVRGKLPGRKNAPMLAKNLAVKIWGVATQLDDAALLYAWSPCKLEGKVSVTIPDFGIAEIEPPAPWGYWIVRRGGEAVPLEMKE